MTDPLYNIQAEIHALQTANVTFINIMELKIPTEEQFGFYQMRMNDALENHPNILNPNFPDEYKDLLRENIKKLMGKRGK